MQAAQHGQALHLRSSCRFPPTRLDILRKHFRVYDTPPVCCSYLLLLLLLLLLLPVCSLKLVLLRCGFVRCAPSELLSIIP